jgi:PAS domain-containing protein
LALYLFVERFENVTGLARQTWLGAAMSDLLDTDAGLLSQWLSTPGRRPDASIQCRYIDAQGQERTTRLSAREMPCGGFRGTATDVTEEVEARRRIEFCPSTTP